jgi:hypothetical protein
MTRLFDELDQHVNAVNDRTGRNALESPDFFEERNPEARAADPEDALAHAVGEDYETALGAGDEGADVPEPQVEPEPGFIDPIHEDIPWWAIQGERERARAAIYRERRELEGAVEGGIELLPPREATAEQARAVLRAWADAAIPPDWGSNVHMVVDFTEAVSAAFAETGLVDANFARQHVEVWLSPPGGPAFRPDGVRFLDPAGERYLFLEHKEPPSTTEIADFISPEGREQLMTEMENDAVAARDLETRGCQGWVYSTSSPEVAEMMTSIIAEIRERSPDLGRMLHAPVVR